MSEIVRNAAMAVYEEANGDIKKATDAFEARVNDDAELRDVLLSPLIRGACYDALRKVCQEKRANIWTAPNYSASGNGHRVDALSKSTLMMFPLPGGKALGDATAEEIQEASKFYIDQGRDMIHKGNWLNMVALAVPEGVAAKDAITEDELARMKEEANGKFNEIA